MQHPPPYLSIVAAARNDDHGANLVRRMQTFIDALVGQAKRHRLPMELVLVEWNPPSGKPPLADALAWPEDSAPCRIRIVTVPAELHRRYRFADALPLYQMIAKNVGIRRAEGEFILATNIDILLSNELMELLAARRLEAGRMYRVDRFDVESEVPLHESLDQQLAYCRAHMIRVNAREGTFALTPEGYRAAPAVEIPGAGGGIFFGPGWYAPEQYFGQVFRWIANRAEVNVIPSPMPRVMVLETDPGPGTNFAGFHLSLLDSAGNLLGGAPVEGPSMIRLRIPSGLTGFGLQITGGGRRSPVDARTLNARVLRCAWANGRGADDPSSDDRTRDTPAVTVAALPARSGRRAWQIAKGGVRFLSAWGRDNEPRRIGLPLPSSFLKRLQLRSETRGLSIAVGSRGTDRPAIPPAILPGALPGTQPSAEAAPADLHVNACGDFTLAHRRHWMELRGYPEFDQYSMNIDSLFCYMAHYGGAVEQILPEPMRIYHIEHSPGSGWTPEGQRILFQRLAEKGVGWLDFPEVLHCASLMARLATTMVFNREDWGLANCDLPEMAPRGRVLPPCV